MNRYPRLPEVVPAMLVTLGLLLSGCTGSSDSGATPAGTSPSKSTTSDPADADTASPAHLVELNPPTSLTPGTYQFSAAANPGVESPDALVEIPDGFDSGMDFYVVSPDGDAFLGLWTVGQVPRDACRRPAADYVTPGPSVDALADALVAQKSTRASTPKPITVSGHQGLYVELAGPRDLRTCGRTPMLWGNPGERGIYSDNQVDRVWIVDVDGQRLVVNAAYGPTSTTAERDKLTSMVESLEFV